MAKAVPALLAGTLLLSVAVTSSAAEPEVCAVNEAQPCGTVLPPDADADTHVVGDDTAVAPAEVAPVDEADVVPVDLAPADQPPTSPRTLGPPTVVNPFGSPAAPAAAPAEAPLRVEHPQPEHLPPGPPNRVP